MSFLNTKLIAGDLEAFQSDPLGFLTQLSKENDVASFRLGPFHKVRLISDPKIIKEILVTKQKYFVKSQDMKVLKSVVGNGLLTSEKDIHQRQRRLIQPAFKKNHISSYGEDMIQTTDDYIQQWKDNEQRTISEDMMNITLGIISKTMFGMPFKDGHKQIGVPMETIMRQAIKRMRTILPLPLWVPTKNNKKYTQAVKSLDNVLYEIISERRKNGEQKEDLLGILMDAKDETGINQMSDRQLRDELMTIFLAGHETTANALIWTFYLLAQNPEAERKLYEEIDGVIGSRKPSPDDYINLSYTQNVFSEALRLYPPAYVIGRKVDKDVEIEGHHFKRGDMILISQYVMHRKPEYFENPNSFIPERFEKEQRKKLPEYAYFPFGGGPRVCIGNHFAMMEAVLVIATIARRFRLKLAEEPKKVKPQPVITLRPKHGLQMFIEERMQDN
ncbi:cytochrome P450 [Bacillus sp. FJAT-45350]|uniref:cytochrome P450 n=1 Tax=Bacillus sp. FJAT-45350 TaxID=2011014 RepID=UPI000BB980DD|nr:cytochrome P450 [Bacillus sp. FJAT-45350]